MKRLFSMILLLAFEASLQGVFAQAPPPPTQLSAISSFYYVAYVGLSWHGSSSLVGSPTYKVYRSASDSVHFELVSSTTYPTYLDYQVLPSTTYYYYVTTSVLSGSAVYESDRSPIVMTGVPAPNGGHKGRKNGALAGRVIDSLTARPIPGVQISIYRISSPGVPLQKLITDGSGHYKATLDTGSYYVSAKPQLLMGAINAAYQPKWYRDAADAAHATPVLIADTGHAVADFALATLQASSLSEIRGTVRDSSGHPLKGATVAVMRSIQEMEHRSSVNDDVPEGESEEEDVDGVGHGDGIVWLGTTDSLGSFLAHAEPGHAYITLATKRGYVSQYFDHQSDPLTANQIALRGDTTGVNFDLAQLQSVPQYTVRGAVRDSTGSGVPSRVILLPLRHRTSPLPVRFAFTDSLGTFAVSQVLPGAYVALAVPFTKYAPAYYRAGAFGVTRWQIADTVSIPRDTAGIAIGVVWYRAGGFARIDGKVETEGVPGRGVNVFAVSDDGNIAGFALTDDHGGYSMEAIPSGHITLEGDLESYSAVTSGVTIAQGSSAVTGGTLSLTPLTVLAVAPPAAVAQDFVLEQNYPNPFNPSTTIGYSVPGVRNQASGFSNVKLSIYDVLGREVAVLVNERKEAGAYTVKFDGTGLASGTYIYRLQAGDNVAARKLVLVR